MTFKLSHASNYVNDETKAKYEKLGFKFVHATFTIDLDKRKIWRSETDEIIIEINSLEDLMRLIEQVGQNLIISRKSIMIYDDYVE